VDQSADEITQALLSGAPEGFLSPEVLRIVAGQMVRYIASTMDEQ